MDPHGIYGTRSANRLRALQRRRMVQNLCLLALLGAIPLVMFLYARLPHARTSGSYWLAPPVAAAAAPVAVAGQTLLVPTALGKLVAIDATTGSQRDIFTTAFPLRAQPLVDGNLVIVPCEDGALYAVDLQSRKVLWVYRSAAAITSRPAVASWPLPAAPVPSSEPAESPVPADETKPLATPPAPASPPGPPASPAPRASPAPPASQTVVIVGNDEGAVVALARGNGKVLWRRNLAAPVGNGITAATASDGRHLVFIPLLGGLSTRGGLQCLDARSGQPLWRFPADNTIYAAQVAPPVAATMSDGRTLVYCVDDTGAVACLDSRDGRKIWKKFARALPGGVESRDALATLRAEPLFIADGTGGLLIVGGNDGGVRCFDGLTGELRWESRVNAPVRSQALAFRIKNGGRYVLIGNDGPVQPLLNVENGRVVSQLLTSGTGFAGGVIVEGDLALLDTQGHLEKYYLPSS